MVIPHLLIFKPCGWAQTPWQNQEKQLWQLAVMPIYILDTHVNLQNCLLNIYSPYSSRLGIAFN